MALTPYITQDIAPGDLRDAARDLMQLDASLNSDIPEPLRTPMNHLQHLVNSYYSNKIEGSSATPAEVLRAQETPTGVETSSDILEIKHHIEAQIRLSIDPIDAAAICSRESIARLHCELYSGLPEKHLRVKAGAGGETLSHVPGELRTRGVRVGHHIPPHADEIGSYLAWFENVYRPIRLHGLAPILAAAGAHHRLLWLHPFIDGNGRAARLFTDEYLKASGLKGYGLWSVSRGFGRDVDAYYTALHAADHVRKGNLDGRGALSDSGLLKFTEYFISTALEQVRFANALMEPSTLNRRIDDYFQMRECTAYSICLEKTLPPLRAEARRLYRALLDHGPMHRSGIPCKLSLSGRAADDLIELMAVEGLIDLAGDGAVSLALPRHSITLLFPGLF